MNFETIKQNLNQDIDLLEEYFNIYKSNKIEYNKKLDKLNNDLNILYNKLCNIYNLSYQKLSQFSLSKEENDDFIQKRVDFTNNLNNLKKKIIYLKEKLYPWPWNELEQINEPYVIGFAKKSMDLFEIKYISNISLKDYHANIFKN